MRIIEGEIIKREMGNFSMVFDLRYFIHGILRQILFYYLILTLLLFSILNPTIIIPILLHINNLQAPILSSKRWFVSTPLPQPNITKIPLQNPTLLKPASKPHHNLTQIPSFPPAALPLRPNKRDKWLRHLSNSFGMQGKGEFSTNNLPSSSFRPTPPSLNYHHLPSPNACHS